MLKNSRDKGNDIDIDINLYIRNIQGLYEIPCSDCFRSYIGRINRRINNRVYEHAWQFLKQIKKNRNNIQISDLTESNRKLKEP